MDVRYAGFAGSKNLPRAPSLGASHYKTIPLAKPRYTHQ
jgi:hypothetical protein